MKMDSTQTITTKKTNTGKIGFILCFVVLSVLGLSSPMLMTPLMIFILPISLLVILLSFVSCVHGLLKKRSRKLAATGLMIDVVLVILLPFVFITFTPPGSVPPPLNRYKFKRACPEAAFWLDFDKFHYTGTKSLNTGIIQKFGTISYYTKDTPYYQIDSVVQYAEQNGWKYHFKIRLNENDFKNYHDNLFEEGDNLAVDCIWYIYGYNPTPFEIENCDVLIFETNNVHGIASFILISEDKTELQIRFASPALPDPGYKFHVPDSFTELHHIQSMQEEENK